jgi:predicted Holliday junction resolvase-like endonuclease
MLLIILVAVIIIGAIIVNYKKIKAIVSSVEAKVEQVSETVSPVLQDVEKMIDQAAAATPKNEVIAKAKKTTTQVKQALPKAKAPKKAK